MNSVTLFAMLKSLCIARTVRRALAESFMLAPPLPTIRDTTRCPRSTRERTSFPPKRRHGTRFILLPIRRGKAHPPSLIPHLTWPIPRTLYGDTNDADNAAPIPVRGGDRLEADIHLNPVPSLHLIVHVPEDATRPTIMPTLHKPTFDGLEQAEGEMIQRPWRLRTEWSCGWALYGSDIRSQRQRQRVHRRRSQ